MWIKRLPLSVGLQICSVLRAEIVESFLNCLYKRTGGTERPFPRAGESRERRSECQGHVSLG